MFWVVATTISMATFAAVIFAAHLLARAAFPETPRDYSDQRGGYDGNSAGTCG